MDCPYSGGWYKESRNTNPEGHVILPTQENMADAKKLIRETLFPVRVVEMTATVKSDVNVSIGDIIQVQTLDNRKWKVEQITHKNNNTKEIVASFVDGARQTYIDR
ncbi:MAG: hypothetical protein F4094_06655 [Synechococcus sp. SB0672_bin_6]|nr:hypothetical protein [Synechococcus sp. SB0675_bin_6]MYJ60141.1 hypothetical protein [Synechococcus sp. SB0672_bin_6]